MIIKAFFAGFFLFNSLPHLFKGITGQTHMTPFKKISSAYLNLVWAFINLILVVVISGVSSGTFNTLSDNGVWAFLAGGFFISMADAQLFSNPNAKLPWHKD